MEADGQMSSLVFLVPLAILALYGIVSAINRILDRWLTHQERMARILAGLDIKPVRRRG